MKYCLYSLALLGNLDFHYQQSSPYARKKLLGSIFTGKMAFEDGKYRTTGLNEVVGLIGLFQKELGNKKTKRLDIPEKTLSNVPFTDLTSNQFIEGMRKIFELEPFIKIHSISESREGKVFIREMAVASL